jgi:crossover junction endodeoxyribonuclease RuvC
VRVLGIDPGFGILGWAVIDERLTAVDYGVIETSSDSGLDERLLQIHTGLLKIIDHHHPEHAALERLFHARNTTTSLDVAKAIGVVLLALRMRGLDYAEYAPSQVKRSLTGYGKAGKEQMQEMVVRIFNLEAIPRPDDAADALAIAACHAMARAASGHTAIRKSS